MCLFKMLDLKLSSYLICRIFYSPKVLLSNLFLFSGYGGAEVLGLVQELQCDSLTTQLILDTTHTTQRLELEAVLGILLEVLQEGC